MSKPNALIHPDRKFPPLVFGNDPTDDAAATFTNYEYVGEAVTRWALAGTTSVWPSKISEFKNQIGDGTHIIIPPEYTAIAIVQVVNGSPLDAGGMLMKSMSDNDYSGLTFLMRLPPKDQLSESRDIIKSSGIGYSRPSLYVEGATDLNLGGEPALHARVAEYTMRGCR